MLAPWEGLGDQSLPVTLGLGVRPGGGPAVLAGAWLTLFSGLRPAHLLLRAPGEVNPLLVHPLSLHPLDEAEEVLVWHGGATGQNSRWAAALVINPGGLGRHGLLAASSGQDPLGSCSQCWSCRGLWVTAEQETPWMWLDYGAQGHRCDLATAFRPRPRRLVRGSGDCDGFLGRPWSRRSISWCSGHSGRRRCVCRRGAGGRWGGMGWEVRFCGKEGRSAESPASCLPPPTASWSTCPQAAG